MNRPSDAEPPAPETRGTGLPWLGTWKSLYLFVLGCFVLWVGLLVALTVIFS
jgi:hypothetical protein